MAADSNGVLGLARAKMMWLSARQGVVASNVANVDTPGFRARDLAPFVPVPPGGAVALTRTDPRHLGPGPGGASAGLVRAGGGEVRENGASVSLEDEMLKLAAIQGDYQAASAVYGRGLGMIRTALGRRG